MELKKSREKLFDEFPPAKAGEWEARIHEDLKGADPEKLFWKMPDGISVRPFYRREDIAALPFIDRTAGEYPFLRGNRTKNNNWEISQDIAVDSFHEANRKANYLLEKGVSLPRFIFSKKIPAKLSQLDDLLSGINLQAIPVMFSLPSNDYSVLELVYELAQKKGFDTAEIKGAIDLDPLGSFVRRGNYYADAENDMLVLKNAIGYGAKYLPSFRILSVSPDIFHNSGASIIQELGFGISTAVEYMSALTDLGLNAFEISSCISFRFAVGSDYFPEIAKLRAARFLWAAITDTFAPGLADSCKMRIDCITSSWSQTVRGKYNNLLRATTQAMSAVLGGADSLMILQFDHASGGGNEFSERLARNIQLILKEEAYFDKVADPGGGSYYIENLTNLLSENAWNLFIDIEKEGGILSAFRKGMIQDMIKKMALERISRIENNTDKIVGVNCYPDPDEKPEGNLARENEA
jgi:methylmalonyl-CoA mutase